MDRDIVERARRIIEEGGDVDVVTGIGRFNAAERDTILRALSAIEGETKREAVLREALKRIHRLEAREDMPMRDRVVRAAELAREALASIGITLIENVDEHIAALSTKASPGHSAGQTRR